MGSLVNMTMQVAAPLAELATNLFPEIDSEVADRALTTLIALGSSARPRLESRDSCRAGSTPSFADYPAYGYASTRHAQFVAIFHLDP